MPSHLDAADRSFARRECDLFLRAIYEDVGAGAFWINPLASQRVTILRPAQLRSASRAGFSIPRTLLSNDPLKIREFLRANPRGVIYKSFFPISWSSPEGPAVLFTSLVREDDLPEGETLRATPGIFQELIPKAYELRVTALGDHLFAAKLRSQEVASAVIDWRAAAEPVPMEPFDLPDSVARACHRVMADLGIVFGCFDLIVTPEGGYVFLEVNEMGAFLWIEQRLPEMGLLDAFCEFLIQGRIDFEWPGPVSAVRWDDVIEEAERQIQVEAPGIHAVRATRSRAPGAGEL